VVKGFKNGAEIFSQNFIVGHDCCHIELKEGNPEIKINTQE
jgi:hypothetical protein